MDTLTDFLNELEKNGFLGKKGNLICPNNSTKTIRNYKKYVQRLYEVTSWLPENFSKADRMIALQQNITSQNIKCPVCGTIRKFNKRKRIWTSTCGKKDKEHLDFINNMRLEKIRATNQEKYGSNFFVETEVFKEKAKQTCLEKYGVKNYSQTEEFRYKFKEVCLKKYCVENPMQLPEVKEKVKQTNLKKYGVKTPMQVPEIKEKLEETNLKKYRVKNPMQLKIFKEKVKATNLEKYGAKYYTQSEEYKNRLPEIKEKVKQTNLKKYGAEYYSQSRSYINWLQSEEGQQVLKATYEKMIKTNLKKYGSLYFCQSEKYKKRLPDIKEKVKQTNLEKYGVETPMQASEIKEKVKATNLEKYGAEYYFQSEEYKKRLPEIREKAKETNLKRYGVPSFNQTHLKNTHLLTKEYLIENFLDENGYIKLQEMQDFFNMKETACYYYMRDNGIKINYKPGGFNPNKPATLYYLLDQETGLYKIGVTNKTIEERFPNADGSKRNMIILEQTYYENGYEALEAEQEILEAFSYCRCINESWPENWGGRTEFFKEDILLKESK